ncbi:MAG: DUF3105 domain-containing protein [Chloroflexi bacterium]|nr:DUF3105 domain-containing protein [Chloroflexota bacterium]
MSRLGLRNPVLIFGALGVLAVVVVVVVISGGGDSRPDYPYTVQTFEDQGTEHLEPGQTYDLYNSDPPTTGPHAPAPAELGVHDLPVVKEVLPHNMEHGGVVVLYDCSAGEAPLDDAGCQNLRDLLAAITEENVADGKLVLMAPYSGMEHPIALTAWRTLDAFDEFDEQRVQAFIDSFERKFNPEGF